MQTDNHRSTWIAIVILVGIATGAAGFVLGHAAASRGFLAAMPARGLGFGLRAPGVGVGTGLGGLVGLLLLLGVGLGFVYLVLRVIDHREPAPPAAPGMPGTPGAPVAPIAPPAATPLSAAEGIDRLRDLAAMHDKGQLTDEEFAVAKRSLLGM